MCRPRHAAVQTSVHRKGGVTGETRSGSPRPEESFGFDPQAPEDFAVLALLVNNLQQCHVQGVLTTISLLSLRVMRTVRRADESRRI